MYDLDKAIKLSNYLKEDEINNVLAQAEGEDYHMSIFLDDIKEDYPDHKIVIQYNQDEYYFHVTNLIKFDIDNDNQYYEVLQRINYYNSGNELIRWYVNANGYIEGIYVPFEIFDRDIEFYYDLIVNELIDEIYSFTELLTYKPSE